MSFTAEELYALLPAVYRRRDSQQGEPLRQLMEVMARQVAVLEENLEQLYDDQFIETCAEWVAPYLGSLIGYRSLHGVVPQISSPRAEVAGTIGFRRRKGTATMLEELARTVTGWPTHVVEFFERLVTTQYMNHLRPASLISPDLRSWEPIERLDSAFDSVSHTLEVRSISTCGGRYNIPNIGVFVYRLAPYRLEDSPATAVDTRRYRFSPLGNDTQLFTRHESEDEISHLAEPINVPEPISRRVLADNLDRYYGEDRSIFVRVDGVGQHDVQVCNLSDAGGGNWAHMPSTQVTIDPVLGRIAFPNDVPAGEVVQVTYHYGFSHDCGGGSYERAASFSRQAPGQARIQVPNDFPSIQAALDNLPVSGGIVEITDSGRYEEAISIQVAANMSAELRAANEHRPTLVLPGELVVSGGEGASVTLNGLLITGARISIPDTGSNLLQRLTIRHSTMVPGLTLDAAGVPQQPTEPSLVSEITSVTLVLEHSITGSLRVVEGCETRAVDSVVDATDPELVAHAGPAGPAEEDPPGGELTLVDCTVFGKVFTERMNLVSNTILVARLGAADLWPHPVRVVRKQEGCVRFSYVPPGSRVPRRYRCQPQFAIDQEIAVRELEHGGPLPALEAGQVAERIQRRIVPGFQSRRYGDPSYLQLRRSTPQQIRTGASDEGEMGVLHKLYQPQREANLKIRFDEYLRFGLEAGIFYET